MANVYATKTGNWSDTTVWNTGALPTSNDDVYSNNYTVTIDQDVTVKSIRNTSATGITAGGGFSSAISQSITASGTGIVSGTSASTCLSLNQNLGATVNVYSNITGGTGGIAVAINGTGTFNFTGSVVGGSQWAYCTTVGGGAIATFTGNITSGALVPGISIGQGCNVTVVGNVTGISNQTAVAGYGISIGANSTVAVTGVVTGGGSGSTITAFGISSSGTCYVTGTLKGYTASAITGNGTWIITGPFLSSVGGIFPIGVAAGVVKLVPTLNNEFRFLKNGGGTASFWSSDVLGNNPATNNVRYGTTYGLSNEFTGTLRVPAANAVSAGILVDNTVGTAALSPSDLSSVIGAAIAAALDSVP